MMDVGETHAKLGSNLGLENAGMERSRRAELHPTTGLTHKRAPSRLVPVSAALPYLVIIVQIYGNY